MDPVLFIITSALLILYTIKLVGIFKNEKRKKAYLAELKFGFVLYAIIVICALFYYFFKGLIGQD